MCVILLLYDLAPKQVFLRLGISLLIPREPNQMNALFCSVYKIMLSKRNPYHDVVYMFYQYYLYYVVLPSR